MDTVIQIGLWFAAITVGIMAGIYFTFSTFVMQSFARLGPRDGMTAMQGINRVIVRSLFLPIFFASTLVCVGLIVAGATDPSAAGSASMLAGSIVYVAGMFVVTVVGNVPLNNALENTDATGDLAQEIWERYMRQWLPLNHVRTVSCIIALGLLILALIERS